MSVFVDVINAYKNRLLLATQNNGPLKSVKSVRVGFKAELRRQIDTPRINISLKRLGQSRTMANKILIQPMVIEILVVTATAENMDNPNSLWNGDLGGLPLLENVLNVIEKDEAGVVDQTLGGVAEGNWTYEVSQVNDDQFIGYNIIITHEVEYVQGGR